MNTDTTETGSRIGLRVTAFSHMGSRKYMEDMFSVAYQKAENGNELDYTFFGMFDGHGGDTASRFAKDHLMNFIVSNAEFWSSNDEDILTAIKKGFIDCHMAMWKDLDKWPPTASGLPSTAGTTASCAFLRKGKLYIGHCGDSGIVLGRTNPKGGKWISQPLTNEHKPESPEELSRIESCGGKVQEKQGTARVVWYRPKNPHQGPIRRNTRIEEIPFLAVARSLGDLWSYNHKTEKFVVSPEPDVSVVEIDVNSFKCLIFASDGLWNVIDADYSVDSVFDTERQNDHNSKLGINNWRNPSRVLVETALEKWRSNFMRADNTSVVCVMLDPHNKRNMFKFGRTPATEFETLQPQESARTIFDYSTSEAYNLDPYLNPAAYGNDNLPRQNAMNDLHSEGGKLYEQLNSRNYHYSHSSTHMTAYNHYETPYGYHAASTSAHHHQVVPGTLTYQTTSNESAFVKACCRNNYTLATSNEQIPYHSTFEQHRQMYENMALRPYPPLHYAYRPVPNHQIPLPSLHTNLVYDQGYLQNAQNYQPMKRYNYLRPTPEELAAMHNEEDEDEDSESNTMEFSDEESGDEDNQAKNDAAGGSSSELEKPSDGSCDDSIQIFEISSSSFNEDKIVHNDSSNEDAKKPTKSNNKENTESSNKKKKPVAPSRSGRFYATRQTDRKMRSGNVGSSLRTIGKEKLARRITKNIKKVVKTLIDSKIAGVNVKLPPDVTRSAKKMATRSNENKNDDKETRTRVLRSAPVKGTEASTLKKMNEKAKIVRSFRSKQPTEPTVAKSTTLRKRPAALLDNVERGRDRRLK